ncbi:hypothetical protein GQ44DRAFT_734136 [Phaeosphaeriaceae sp. PMI808]|nr:hypothetical protein GQ44DRAFT_734136 [Phaeosphaeriaceae sp. PMI808]
MPPSLKSLPAEIQLNIFHRLVPKDPDDPNRKQHAHLRLVCKSFHHAATEVLFEDFFLLIRTKDQAYIEPGSFKLLHQNPHLAALVRRVWVAHAATSPAWLHAQVSFESTRILENADTTWNRALGIIKNLCFSFDLGKNQECASLTLAQQKAIREYYSQYTSISTYLRHLHQYSELPANTKTIEVLLKKILCTFSNLQCIRIAPPLVIQTSLYTKRYRFLKEIGLETWAEGFKESQQISNSCNLFPWRPRIVKLCLEQLPTTCKSLELPVLDYNCRLNEKIDLQTAFECRPDLQSQINTLVLCISKPFSLSSQWLNAWVDLTNRFSKLTTLSLVRRNQFLNWEDATEIRDNYKDYMASVLLSKFSLPNVRSLSLESLILELEDLSSLNEQFPDLRELRLINVAIIVPPEEETSEIRQYLLWYRAARSIGRAFGGNCSFIFDQGPFIEIQRRIHSRTVSDDEFWKPEPAVTHILKTPALGILSEVSRCPTTDTRLENRYIQLSLHENPIGRVCSQTFSEDPGEKPVQGTGYTVVDTPGMKILYYEDIYNNNVDNSQEE